MCIFNSTSILLYCANVVSNSTKLFRIEDLAKSHTQTASSIFANIWIILEAVIFFYDTVRKGTQNTKFFRYNKNHDNLAKSNVISKSIYIKL